MNLSQDRKDRIKRTVFQALKGLALTAALTAIGVAVNIISTDYASMAWAGVATAMLTALSAALQNIREAKED